MYCFDSTDVLLPKKCEREHRALQTGTSHSFDTKITSLHYHGAILNKVVFRFRQQEERIRNMKLVEFLKECMHQI